jgi:hypothetical protein
MLTIAVGVAYIDLPGESRSAPSISTVFIRFLIMFMLFYLFLLICSVVYGVTNIVQLVLNELQFILIF